MYDFCIFAAKYSAFMSTIIGRKSEIQELERHFLLPPVCRALAYMLLAISKLCFI